MYRIQIGSISRMSAFMVRRMSQHSLHNNPPKPPLSINPPKILFQQKQQKNKLNIVKVILTNTSNTLIEYQIRQPKQPYFKVMYNKNVLAVGESVEAFVFFNLDIGLVNCLLCDQFVVVGVTGNWVLNVPILVRTDTQAKEVRKKIRKQSKTKENLKLLKLQNQPRPIGQKRNGGIAVINKKVKYGDIKQSVTFGYRIEKFSQDFINIQNFLKNKLIKCEVYIGEKPFTREKYDEIIAFNQDTEQMARDIMREKILNCHTTKKSRKGPSVRNFDMVKLSWNRSRNEPKITYKNALEKLLRQVRSFVIYHRFKKMNKILSIYRSLREQQNIQQPQTKIINNKFEISVEQNKSQCQLLDLDDNSEDREYQRQIQEKKKHDYYCRKINKMITTKKDRNLGADFAQFTLMPRLLPMFQEKKKDHLFQIKPRIGFDNWVALEELAPYSHEQMKYEKIEGIAKWECHPFYQFNKNKSNLETQQAAERNAQISEVIKIINRELVSEAEQTILAKPFQENFFSKSQSRYKNFQYQQKQIDFLSADEQRYLQLDIQKPIKQNFKGIHEIKTAKLQYFPYFQTPLPSPAYNLLNQSHLPPLIYEIKKEDRINFDQTQPLIDLKIDYIENNHKIHSESLRNSQNQPKNAGSQTKRQNERCPLPTQTEQHALYERILQNIDKTKRRKQNRVSCKIASFNAFIKKNENKIFY